MKINRFLPLAISLIIFLFFQFYFLFPRMIYIILVLINLAIFFVTWQFAKFSQVDKKWWNFFILPSLMSTMVLFYTLFLNNKTIIQLLFLADVIMLFFYLRYIYFYLIKPVSYEVFSIENISSYGNFFTFFLLAAVIYGLQSFLDISLWQLVLAVSLLSLLLVYQYFWASKIDLRNGLPYILINSLILVELSWAISFLPLNFQLLGLCLAVCYYMSTGIIGNYLLDKLNGRKVKIYLILGLISLALILLTARWI